VIKARYHTKFTPQCSRVVRSRKKERKKLEMTSTNSDNFILFKQQDCSYVSCYWQVHKVSLQ
jgi:hypothetical protein